LSRNFYKGVKGDAINVLLAAAAYNFKRAMRALLYLIKRISIELVNTSFMLKYSF
ncbi:IS5 family transposase, partial [Hoylesella shahii DSM 15611 = JCM 12083]